MCHHVKHIKEVNLKVLTLFCIIRGSTFIRRIIFLNERLSIVNIADIGLIMAYLRGFIFEHNIQCNNESVFQFHKASFTLIFWIVERLRKCQKEDKTKVEK